MTTSDDAFEERDEAEEDGDWDGLAAVDVLVLGGRLERKSATPIAAASPLGRCLLGAAAASACRFCCVSA